MRRGNRHLKAAGLRQCPLDIDHMPVLDVMCSHRGTRQLPGACREPGRTQGVKEEVDRARTDPEPHLHSRHGRNVRDQRLSIGIPLPYLGTKQLQTSAKAFPKVLPFLNQSFPPNSSTGPSPEKRFA